MIIQYKVVTLEAIYTQTMKADYAGSTYIFVHTYVYIYVHI